MQRVAASVLLWLCLTVPAVRAEAPLFLVNSPFEDAGELQPTRIYAVDPATGALTLVGDLGSLHTAVLALASVSGTEFYAVGSDTVADADGTCFSCVLLHVVLDPGSTTPALLEVVGLLRSAGVPVEGMTGLTFRSDGTLWAASEQTDELYRVDPETADLTQVGAVTIDPGGGCGSTVLDVIGGDLTFDALGHLWLWTNTPGTDKGLWELNPANGCAVQSASCPSSRHLAGLAVIGHMDVATQMRGVSANDERLYRVVPGSCPVSGEPGSLPLTLGGEFFNVDRGDMDSPYCANDAACDDGNACTTETCTAGGCDVTAVVCDDGNPCTTDTCAPSSGCRFDSVGPPSEVADVQLSRTTGVTALSWTPQPAPLAYDLAGGSLTALRTDGSVVQAVCLGSSGAPPFQDAGPDPTAGQGFYYLVRAHGTCGAGSYGVASSGAERVPAAPCP
jgi:hypothetical protein